MKKVATVLAVVLLSGCQTAYADDAWDAECSGNLSTIAQQQEAAQGAITGSQFMTQGVVSYNGYEWTWYSENVLPGDGLDELNANGRSVNEDGYVVDGDGFIAIASPWGIDEVGTVINTPFGMGKVYDTCENDSYDVYVSW